MKRFSWTFGLLIVAGVATAIAQPPGGPGGRGGPGGGPPPGGGRGRPPQPVIEALDADGNHIISSEELQNATKVLLALDKNHDGQLSEDEFGPGRDRPGMGANPVAHRVEIAVVARTPDGLHEALTDRAIAVPAVNLAMMIVHRILPAPNG